MHREKVHADMKMQDNPGYGLRVPNLSLSEHNYGAQKLGEQQTSNVDEHVYAHTTKKLFGNTEKHSSTSEKKYDYAIVTTPSSAAENHGYTTVGEQTAATERLAVYDEASGADVTQSVHKSLEDNRRQISATDHDHVTHGYVNVSKQISATGKNVHDEAVKTSTVDDHVYDQPVTS